MAEAPTSPAGGSHESGGEQSPQGGGGGGSGVREQDRYLPIANISRIMKKALPQNGKIAKDAKDTVQECVSEFISFVTSEYFFFSSFSLSPLILFLPFRFSLFNRTAFVFILLGGFGCLGPVTSAKRRSVRPSTVMICCGRWPR